MISKFVFQLKSLTRFLGRESLVWIVAGTLGGLALSLVETGLATLLQSLLRVLGVTDHAPVLPGGFVVPELSIVTFCILMVAAGILRAACNFLMVQSAVVTYEIINSRLKLLTFHETLKLKRGFLSLSKMNSQIGELFPKTVVFCNYLVLLIPNIIFAFILLIAMAITAPRQTVVGVIGLGVIGTLVNRITRKVRTASAELPKEHEALMKGITRVVRNWFLLKALRTGDLEHRKLIRATLAYSTHTIRANFYANFGSTLPSVFGIALLSGIIYFQVAQSNTSPIQFLGFLYLYMRFIQVVGTLAVYAGSLSATYPQFAKTSEFFFGFDQKEQNEAVRPALLLRGTGRNLKQIHEAYGEKKFDEASERIDAPAPKIEVDRLSFRYAPDLPFILQNTDLLVEAGSQFGIMGKSGSGKSTLLGLLMGVLDPTHGSIRIDGASPGQFLSDSRNQLGYVGAEPFLIDGSVRQNLKYGTRYRFTDSELEEALRAARLWDFVSSLKDGLGYRISENGEGLSTGQKQRLSLARAFLSSPKLLILDEISANLDDKTEAEITDSILKLKGVCTTLIVSHRAGILKNADQVFKL